MIPVTPTNWKKLAVQAEQAANNEDKIKHLLQFSVLSPSTHNSQPWLFKIKDASCQIYYDPKITLPEADLKGRDLYISLGCLIESLVIISNYYGVFKSVKYLSSNPKSTLVAEVEFRNLSKMKRRPKNQKEVYGLVNRITHRGIWLNKKVPSEILNKVSKLNKYDDLEAYVIEDKEKIGKFAKLTAAGLKEAYNRSEFRKEMSKWVNPNSSKRLEGIPGYALRMNGLISSIFPKVVGPVNLGPLLAKVNEKSVSSSPCIVVITAKKDSRKNWLDTGRIAQRIMVELNSDNIKTSIFIASVEIGDLYKQVKELLNTDDTPQFLFCAGYMKHRQNQTPRHPIEDKLI